MFVDAVVVVFAFTTQQLVLYFSTPCIRISMRWWFLLAGDVVGVAPSSFHTIYIFHLTCRLTLSTPHNVARVLWLSTRHWRRRRGSAKSSTHYLWSNNLNAMRAGALRKVISTEGKFIRNDEKAKSEKLESTKISQNDDDGSWAV